MLLPDQPTAFVDLETTGSRAGFHRITEIAIVTASAHGNVERWSTLLNPGREIPLQISALTGITDEMVADAPFFEDIWREVLDRLDGHLFVAHNVRFDYGFLRNAFRALEKPFRPKRLCTVALSRALYPQERYHNLDALMQRHQLTCEPRHRALTDASALWEWSTKVAQELGASVVEDAVRSQLAGPALPNDLAPERIKSLPQGPGVYRFFGADETLLYVGKSVNIRTRVLSHFSAASRDNKEAKLFARTVDVDALPTASELGALLLEAQLIKRDRPVLNRRLRHQAPVFTIALEQDTQGYAIPRVKTLALPDGSVDQYGLFRQRSAAKKRLQSLVDEHQLCRKKLGIETGPGSCFGFQIKRCAGACAGKQSAVAWQLQLLAALGPSRVQDWPHDGPVAYVHKRGRRVDLHVADQWCLLGTVDQQQDIADVLDNERRFDLDIYKILLKFTNKPETGTRIELLSSAQDKGTANRR